MTALWNAGVPAGVCQTAEDRCDNDPQLRHRKWLTEVTGSKIGTWPVYELPMKLSRTPAYIGGPVDRGDPGYGEDNAWLLTSLRGLTQSDVQRLAVGSGGFRRTLCSANRRKPAGAAEPSHFVAAKLFRRARISVSVAA